MASLKDKIRRRQQLPKRVAAVGLTGTQQQDARAKKAGPKGAAREAVRRVGEYRRGRVDPADGNNDTINRRSQENLK